MDWHTKVNPVSVLKMRPSNSEMNLLFTSLPW
jgi:hypothetical protein